MKKYKKYLEIAGRIITVLCLVFIVYQLVTQNIDYSILLNPVILATVVISIIVLSCSVYINTGCWKWLLEALFDTRIKYFDAMSIYVKSNLGKYLPGNVMHYAGRNIIGKLYDLSHKQMATATIFEVVFKILSVAIIIVTFAFESFRIAVEEFGIDSTIIFVLIALIILTVTVFVLVYNQILKKREAHQINYFKMVLVLLFYTIIFLLNALCFILISGELVGWETIIANFPTILGSYLIAWLLGYLMPGSSGGIGIRESVMMLLLSGVYGRDAILLASVLLRIATTLGDLLAYGILKYGIKIIWKDRFTEIEKDIAIEEKE